MRNEWYGDKRDLVKWSGLLHLSKLHGADSILQVALLRPSRQPTFEVDGRSCAVPSVTWNHFRDIRKVIHLAGDCAIKVFEREFQSKSRRKYFEQAHEFYLHERGDRSIVFVDPDTGLASGKVKPEHISADELAEIYNWLRPNDLLVLYQHKPLYATGDWIGRAAQRFAEALSVDLSVVTKVTGTTIGKDVAFFAAIPTETPGS